LIECDDLTSLLRLGIRNQNLLESAIHGHPLLQLGYRLRHLLRTNTRSGSRRNISAHYDLGNDFYALWLDPSMTYSSARFTDYQSDDLTSAQANKYQRMIELTGAKAGDHLLEVGCGWGGFAEHAARRGIHVHGITLSTEQLEYARRRIEHAGLSHLASFALRDYRDVDKQYDHIVSIEMLEAVGERYWNTYFDRLRKLLKPGGRAAIQVITISDDQFDAYRRSSDFIQRYIFPGGMLPSMEKLLALADESRMRIENIECFGKDYAETLRRWQHNFNRRQEDIRKLGFDEEFARIWRFYLAYCEAGFDEARIDVVQLQLCHSDLETA
jgi:cyclopropane-fatty-acyl-phospholipid synthase